LTDEERECPKVENEKKKKAINREKKKGKYFQVLTTVMSQFGGSCVDDSRHVRWTVVDVGFQLVRNGG
jgi:hypothetical protein